MGAEMEMYEVGGWVGREGVSEEVTFILKPRNEEEPAVR